MSPAGATNVRPDETRRETLATLLHSYAETLHVLVKDFSPSELLEALLIRDAIEQRILSGEVRERRLIDAVREADDKLRRLPLRIFRGVRRSFAEWRESVTPPPRAWWWFLDRSLPARVEQFERVLLLVSVLMFPFSLAVAIELARLYGGDDLGFVSLLPITATFLGSLSLGGVLSIRFRDRWALFLEQLGLDARWRVFGTFVIFILLSTMVALWFARPRISRHYNERGVSTLIDSRGPQTQLSSALINLERAVRFDPNNAVAHYNLGRVYEDLLDEDQAITEYLIAFRAGLDLAGNNVSHLYLARGQYDRAAIVLQKTASLAVPGAAASDRELRYAMLKNLGWARYGQARLSEARRLLEEAVRVNPNGADAHCLLAKTLQAMHDQTAAREWRSCLGLAWQEVKEPAREIWIGEAKKFLERTP